MSYRYIGNKTRVLPQLMTYFRELCPDGGTVVDPMCGTASVSAALRSAGYTVIASDLMTFAVQHAVVRLKMARPPGFRALGMPYAEVLDVLNALEPLPGYYHREYSGEGSPLQGCPPRKYLTGANAAKVDAIQSQLDAWKHARKLTDRELVLLRHDLVLAVNKVANIAGTYGHFRSTWSATALKPLVLRPTEFEPGPTAPHQVMQGPAESVVDGITADLCYIDPPYMKRQYAANYHLIETIARGDQPEAIGISGLRDWWDQYSDFCSKRRIADAFAAIFSKLECPRFLISYSEDGLLSQEQMSVLLSDFGRVRVHEFEHTRFRSNGSALGRQLREFVFDVETN